MLSYDDIATGTGVNAMQRFKDKAGCSSSFELRQFWSKTGVPDNAGTGSAVNAFNVPWSQKWNAQYLTVKENPETTRYNRFRVAAQIYYCSDGRVGSQVFSQSNQDTFTGFCNGAVSWSKADSIWREIIGEIHRAKKLGTRL
jgi:predicted PhzF superfamily epimerase YddE/YHI9